jgi:raffinose/stachyose/melibiose transport system substrate-binding protein
MKKTLLWIVILAISISMVAAFSTAAVAEETPSDVVGTLKIWDMEVDNAFSASWDFAREEFKAMYPNVTVQYELKTFEQMQETGKMILNSNDVPDVMQCNKGSATAGMYAREGLLTDLTAEAEARGWNDIMSSCFQTTCRYNKQGIMGSGNLYGVTNYGEFVMVYYNKDMFTEYNVEVPTSLAEFEAVCDKFVAAGIVPITLGGLSGWPVAHDWYELVLYKADRDLINNYQLFQGDVDFQGAAYTFGAEKLAEYATKGYFGKNALGISYDDANAAFIQGQTPMNITGSWWYGTALTGITDYDWGIFLLPGKNLYQGSGGDLWVVPEKAKNKDLAYEFIDLTMQKEAQTVMANAGGIPINADLTQITDPHVLDLNTVFNSIVQNDGLAFYPDWPVPGYIDIVDSNLQELFAGTLTPEEFNNAISIPYNEYKESLK